MSLQFKEITADVELDVFAEAFAKFVSVKLPLSYLQQGKIIGCFNSEDQLVGGYAMITSPRFRGLMFIPDSVKRESDFLRDTPESDMMEVNCIWLSKAVNSKVDRIRFWMQAVRDVTSCDRKFVLIYFNSQIHGLKKWYSYIGMTKLFEGTPKQHSGEKTHDQLYIGYVRRFKLKFWLWRAAPLILARLLRRSVGFSRIEAKHRRNETTVI